MLVRNLFLFLILSTLTLTGCTARTGHPQFVTTSYPLASILKEVVGTRGEVEAIIPPGASPHTYSPKPSDYTEIQSASAFFYVSADFDEWAVKSGIKTRKIEMIKLVPKENLMSYNDEATSNDKNIDAHFWTDPMTVKAMLPALVDSLSRIDPDNAASYKTNADLFGKRLDLLSRQVESIVKPIIGKTVFLHHPSFRYFLNRYKLIYGGSIENSPGKEPSVKYLMQMTEKIKSSGTKAIFSEPQLPSQEIASIGREAKVNIYDLDEVGGTKKMQTYSEIILFNARTLRKALE